MKNVFFSIIIPIYNVEKYLEECIESVLSQTINDFEVILVDDGSTDSCTQICNIYQKRDNRIKTIHKHNGGLSSARNEGLKNAKGKYVFFLDSDDYWNNNNALKNLKHDLNENPTDILIFNCYLKYSENLIVEDRTDRLYPANLSELSKIEQQKIMIENDIVPGSAWIMAIKREFLVNNNLFFYEGIKSEDTEWMFRLLNYQPLFSYNKIRFYVYRKNRLDSITKTVDEKHIRQYLKIITKYCDDHNEKTEIQSIIKNYVAYHYLIVLSLINNYLNRSTRKELLNDAKKYQFLLNYDLNPKVKIAKKIFRFLGFNAGVKALGIYHKNSKH